MNRLNHGNVRIRLVKKQSTRQSLANFLLSRQYGSLSMKQITLKDIAEATGFSKSTVARALSGATKVNPEKEKVILQTAKDLGYKKDPVLSALSSRRWDSNASNRGNLAFIVNWKNLEDFNSHKTYNDHWLGAKAEADRMGYNLEIIWTHSPQIQNNPEILNRVLQSRGILGILIAPQQKTKEYQQRIPIDWEKYSVVRLGYSYLYEAFNVVIDAQMMNTANALMHLYFEYGCRRVGMYFFTSTLPGNPRLHGTSFIAGYYMACELSDQDKLPLLYLNHHSSDNTEKLKKYIEEHQLDGLICNMSEPSMIQNLPQKTRDQVTEIWFTDEKSKPGSVLFQNHFKVGQEALKLLSSMIFNNERGIPEQAKKLLIDGQIYKNGTLMSPKPEHTSMATYYR